MAQNTYITVDKSRYEVFVGSDPKIERDTAYDPDAHKYVDKTHKSTGLPVWVVNAEVVDTATQEVVGDKIKILAPAQPELRARSVAYVDGELRVFAWAQVKRKSEGRTEGVGHQAWNVLGTLTNTEPKPSGATAKGAVFAGGEQK